MLCVASQRNPEGGRLMLDGISYAFRLSRLQRRQRVVAAENDRQLRILRRPPQDRNSILAAESEARFDDQEFEGAIDELQTRYIIGQIRKYRLPYPESSEWEEEEPPFYYRHLKRAAMVRLQAAIRLEQKERWEHRYRWVPVLTGLTGLIGTVIGLVAGLVAAFK
jgi:hypothetical protein